MMLRQFILTGHLKFEGWEKFSKIFEIGIDKIVFMWYNMCIVK